MGTAANTVISEAPSPRVMRRQKRTRNAILAAATQCFADKSVASVSVEEIIENADVSRGTFYKLFRHKEEVLSEILRPLMERYGESLAAVDATDPQQIFDQVIEVYIDIWREAPLAFSLVQKSAGEYFALLEEAHRPVMLHMRRIFKLIEPHGILRADDADTAVTMTARCAVSVLRVYDGHPEWERLFAESMRGLLLQSDSSSAAETNGRPGRDL